MKIGEIPPHWTDLTKHNSELATDITIDLENTWAADTSDCEGDPINLNLVLTWSFKESDNDPLLLDIPLTKIVTFEDPNSEPSGIADTDIVTPVPAEEPLSTVDTNNYLFMPKVRNIDTMTLRRSRCTIK